MTPVPFDSINSFIIERIKIKHSIILATKEQVNYNLNNQIPLHGCIDEMVFTFALDRKHYRL